jgi:uncharacterized membrane protein YphA (DoxX/SURF4 family)
MKQALTEIYWPLRLTYGLVPLLAGLDKYVGLLADWESYVSPAMASILPFSVTTLMRSVGAVEVLVGLAVLLGLTRLGALVAAAWLTAIALQLAAGGHLDVAVRDLAMAVGAYTLARVAQRRGEELLPAAMAAGAQPLPERP